MVSIYLWEVLSDLKPEIVSKINKIIVFGYDGTEVIFSTSDGKVYGFGNNSFGGLGFGHKNEVKEPQNIVDLNDKQVIDISYGTQHVLAQTITGKLYSWGENFFGQLGIGTNTSDYRPKLIDSLSDKCVIAMSCGSFHTLVLTDDNQLYGFGHNINGQIGCENTRDQLKPIKIIGFNEEILVSISCGRSHSLALTQTGNVYSLGWDKCYQIEIPNYIPRKIVVSNGLLFKQIACGEYHSLLLSECGDVYAFGNNTFGALGTGHSNERLIPKKIKGIKRVKEIASHSQMQISMAKLEDNNYLVWGQCLTGIIHKPKHLRLKSFNDIIVVYSFIANTVKPIENELKLNKTLKKLSENFNDKAFSDIVFKVGDKEIFVNKFILRVNSDYFRNKYSVKSTEITESSTETNSSIELMTKDSEEDQHEYDEVLNNYHESRLNVIIKDSEEEEYEEVFNNYSYEEFNKDSDKSTEIKESLSESFDGIENIEIIDNYSYEVFYSYLKYIYTECVEIENQYLDQLLILSIEHKDEDLIIKCCDRMLSSDKNSITIEIIAELLKLSVDNNMNELKAKCIERIKSM